MARPNGPFGKIMPPSSSTTIKSVWYDVFINHRGPDTKQTLAASIYSALKPLGVEVFLDEPELQLGDSIPFELQYAITTSFLHIVILSPRYAESTWCLQELSLMLKTGQKVILVFYNVDISDIRYIKGNYAKAFSKHEAQARYTSQMLEEWKMALQTVSFFKDHTVNNEE
ncbi:TMV resistance protein N-like [Cryptomeria japonica]|uniref:TMV resistance protein N-like n=1 Tax=Cryptomeria japonica TaxID=3369 RepID=UPI0025ABD146|nr:TMV resistance protein N-like [Cryptomeria japonica]